MIIEGLCNLVPMILSAIMACLDVLPAFPEYLINNLNSFFDLVFDNLSLFGFFVRIETFKVIIPLFLVVYNFETLYKFIMWIVRKIPLSIE